MPPSNWDYRPKDRVRHVHAPPRRRPILRVLLLAGLGLGLYFGFEPMSRHFSAWMKKSPRPEAPKAPGSPVQKPQADPQKTLAAKTSLTDMKSLFSFDRASRQDSLMVDSGFEWSKAKSGADMTLHCQANRESQCLDALEIKRPGLSPWVAQALGRETPPFTWQATLQSEIDSLSDEATLTSLLRLTVRKGRSVTTYKPMRNGRNWKLCPSKGCDSAEPIRFPVGRTQGLIWDEDQQALRVLGTEAQTALLAPAAGWVALLDTLAAEPSLLRLAIDHANIQRTEWKGPLGSFTVASALFPGQAIKAGQKIGTLMGKTGNTLPTDSLADSTAIPSWVSIAVLQQGSPHKPEAWAMRLQGENREP